MIAAVADFLTTAAVAGLVNVVPIAGSRTSPARGHSFRRAVMSRSSRYVLLVGTVVAVVCGAAGPEAFARKQYMDEFKAMYVKADGTDSEKALAAAVEGAKCNVCHKGTSKKERNAYGEALAALLDKKEDAKNVEKIKESLTKVADMASDGKSGPTFGALIKEGKLPGGN